MATAAESAGGQAPAIGASTIGSRIPWFRAKLSARARAGWSAGTMNLLIDGIWNDFWSGGLVQIR